VFAPIHIISEEEVVAFGRVLSVFEETQEVVELTVDVPTDFQRGL
jgi:hypothetical protein